MKKNMTMKRFEGADQSTFVLDDVTERETYCCLTSDDGYECGEYFFQ